MQTLFKWSLFALATLFASAPVTSQQLPPIYISTVKLYPWGYLDNDQPKGIHIDTLEALSKVTGIAFVPLVKPYARVEKDMIEGHTPFAFLAADDEERRSYARYGPALFKLDFGIAYINTGARRSLANFTGLDIGVPRGLTISKCFNSATKVRVNIVGCSDELTSYFYVPVAEYSTGLRLLAEFKLDGLLGSIPTMKRILSDSLGGISSDSVSQPMAFLTLDQVPIRVMYSRNSRINLDSTLLHDAYLNLKRSGTLEAIYLSHMGST